MRIAMRRPPRRQIDPLFQERVQSYSRGAAPKFDPSPDSS
jgi:hypothetical protein